MGERLRRQAPPHVEVQSALGERAKHVGVALGPDDDGDGVVVLGRGADHRRAADVDLLDRLLERDFGPADRGHERVEVAAHQVDLAQAVLLGATAASVSMVPDRSSRPGTGPSACGPGRTSTSRRPTSPRGACR